MGSEFEIHRKTIISFSSQALYLMTLICLAYLFLYGPHNSAAKDPFGPTKELVEIICQRLVNRLWFYGDNIAGFLLTAAQVCLFPHSLQRIGKVLPNW